LTVIDSSAALDEAALYEPIDGPIDVDVWRASMIVLKKNLDQRSPSVTSLARSATGQLSTANASGRARTAMDAAILFGRDD
jgi:hypothetical protein